MKWGHPHYEQLNKMAKYCRYNVYGKLLKCGGCCLVKSRAIKPRELPIKPLRKREKDYSLTQLDPIRKVAEK